MSIPIGSKLLHPGTTTGSAVHYCILQCAVNAGKSYAWQVKVVSHAQEQTCDTADTELYAANKLVAQLRALIELQLFLSRLAPPCTLRIKRQASQ